MQCSKPGTYSGPLQCLIDTVKGEGPRALYKGATLLLTLSIHLSIDDVLIKVWKESTGASPPAVGWAISDSMLMGSLHQYRLLLASIETRSNNRDEGVSHGSSTPRKKGDEPTLGLSLPGHFVCLSLSSTSILFPRV